ncbi:MAG TPA: hypothetical protein VHF67_10990 [Gaiellaceae bacterium]|nr:hypothetical protein [Gaiellaceae bacterium]
MRATALESEALAWVVPHRNGRHLMRTREWLLRLRPDAGEALVLAALLHDVDRNVDAGALDRHVAAWNEPAAVQAHAERAAEVAAAWLRSEGADEPLVSAVAGLISRHETGGGEDADALQAADSLSFLEVNPAAVWVQEARTSRADAERKLRWMHDRIRLEEARAVAAPLLERALAELVGAASVVQDGALAGRLRRQANEGRAHGNTR